jgi:hypothetical protein
VPELYPARYLVPSLPCYSVYKSVDHHRTSLRCPNQETGMLRTCVKYYEKTTDFQDGDCLVTGVLKGMGAIMKPPTDLTAYFDLDVRNRVKLKLKNMRRLLTVQEWTEYR